MQQRYFFKEVKARKNCYCSICTNDILRGNVKVLIYIDLPHEREVHQTGKLDDKGDEIVEVYEFVRLIGITHKECKEEFVKKNKEEGKLREIK